ncbi:hypothetical protein SE27_01120 [Acinetobacter harbinensis]|uniref:hypothetical protein n=1 Tax=Acinetobacter harbinensis TaxID=1353941 RepID=UPI0005806DD3|nr:hypothetical protein [Acinetobacter harbinensis]KWQ03982.1 hypothetical protein SE27_01120 [Acinetobacter harbinensis]
MKKALILFLILILMCMVKLGYELLNLSVQQSEFSSSLHQIEQNNANLNDQLVAVQRQLSTAQGTTQSDAKPTGHLNNEMVASIEPVVLIQQQLDLIEFMLKQHQFNDALDKLLHLDRNLESYTLAPSLKHSLHQAIQKDQQSIQQVSSARAAQQAKVTLFMQQLDQALSAEINSPQLTATVMEPRYFWQRWILIEPAKQPATALIQRPLILKEAQLRLLLANHALQQGQYLEYQQALMQIIQLLNKVPDAKSRQLIQKIQTLKDFTVIPVPLLNTRALVG